MNEKYGNRWKRSGINSLFSISCESIDDFTKLDKKLREEFIIKMANEFIENFQVDANDEIHKETIMKCLEIFKYLRGLHFTIFRRSMSNKKMRRDNLEKLRDYFKLLRLDGSNGTEQFLPDTLNHIIDLDIDCIQLETGVAIDYIIAYLSNLANVSSYDELLLFITLFDNATIVNINHNYLQAKVLRFLKSIVVASNEDCDVSYYITWP